jgi:hypothetical protein
MAKPSPILWVWYFYQFDKYRPTTEKFLQSRWHHYHFCKRKDRYLTISRYLDTLTEEIRSELLKDKITYLRTLTFGSFLDALGRPEIRKEIAAWFERDEISKGSIRDLQVRINQIRNPGEPAAATGALTAPEFYSKTYIIATHLHFELAGKEADYEVLARLSADHRQSTGLWRSCFPICREPSQQMDRRLEGSRI